MVFVSVENKTLRITVLGKCAGSFVHTRDIGNGFVFYCKPAEKQRLHCALQKACSSMTTHSAGQDKQAESHQLSELSGLHIGRPTTHLYDLSLST